MGYQLLGALVTVASAVELGRNPSLGYALWQVVGLGFGFWLIRKGRHAKSAVD